MKSSCYNYSMLLVEIYRSKSLKVNYAIVVIVDVRIIDLAILFGVVCVCMSVDVATADTANSISPFLG